MPRHEVIERFERKFVCNPETECWDWEGGVGANGYGGFWIDGRTDLAHRAAYTLYICRIPAGMFVCHRCDTRLCVNPAHLFIGTPTDNMSDRDSKGRQAKGTSFGRSKLNDAAVREILSSPLSDSALARQFAVTKGAINHVRHRRNWRHIEDVRNG